jgi:thioredoxin 1
MSNSFLNIIQSEKPVLVDFYAEWCGPCKMMAPILQDVKEAMGDAVTIIKIDVDKHPQLSQQLQIQGVPTLMVFQKGQPMWRQNNYSRYFSNSSTLKLDDGCTEAILCLPLVYITLHLGCLLQYLVYFIFKHPLSKPVDNHHSLLLMSNGKAKILL